MGEPNNQLDSQLSLQFIRAGTVDPSVIATDASKGTLFIWISGTPKLFQKQDDGLTTSWVEFDSAVGAGANQTLSNLMSPAAINKDFADKIRVCLSLLSSAEARCSSYCQILCMT